MSRPSEGLHDGTEEQRGDASSCTQVTDTLHVAGLADLISKNQQTVMEHFKETLQTVF